MMFRVLVFLLVTALPEIASKPVLPQPNAISCQQVLTSVMPCLGFIKGEPNPSQACCGGVAELTKLATTRPDRIAVCGCLKDAMGKISGPYNASLLPTLPAKCNVQTTLPPIDKNYDCNQVTMFHFSDSNDEPRHEKQDSENYNDILDVPMNEEKNRMENYKHIQDVPMTQEQDRMTSKGTVCENYKYIKHVPMAEEQDKFSENYDKDNDVIFDALVGFYTGLITSLKEYDDSISASPPV